MRKGIVIAVVLLIAASLAGLFLRPAQRLRIELVAPGATFRTAGEELATEDKLSLILHPHHQDSTLRGFEDIGPRTSKGTLTDAEVQEWLELLLPVHQITETHDTEWFELLAPMQIWTTEVGLIGPAGESQRAYLMVLQIGDQRPEATAVLIEAGPGMRLELMTHIGRGGSLFERGSRGVGYSIRREYVPVAESPEGR